MVLKRSRSVDWNDLQYFAAAVAAGSRNAAARQLGIDHATVGRRIRRLEQRLGLELVDPSRVDLVLTEAGRQVLVLADSMGHAAFAVERLADRGPALSGSIRLTTTENFAARYLAARLVPFQQRHPGITLELVTTDRSLSLTRREADIALRFGRPVDQSLYIRKIGAIGSGLYGTPDCLAALARGRADWRFIAHDKSQPPLPEAAWLERFAAGREIVMRAASIGIRLEAAAQGLGVACLPHYAACRDSRLTCEAELGTVLTRPIWLLVHRDLRDIARIRALTDFLAGQIASDKVFLQEGR